MRKCDRNIALVTASNALTQNPPLNLLCLSTVLEQNGYATDIYDLHVAPHLLAKLVDAVKEKRYLWIGVTSLTPSIPMVKRCIDEMSIVRGDTPILMGGIHASSLPELTLRELNVDAVCVGDGEDAAVAFSEKALNSERDYWKIPGVAAIDERGNYRFDLEIARMRAPKPHPRPNWEKIDISTCQKCPSQYIKRGKIVAPIIITKGCPNRCTFCAAPQFPGRKLIQRDVNGVVDEIEYLVRRRGVDEIHIFDDNFNCNLSYAKNVLREWLKRGIKVMWKAPIGFWIHSCDDEWLSLLVATGCYQVGFGIESGSQEILKRANKSVRLNEIHGVLQKYRNHGISTFGFFIMGLPGETRETIDTTVNFACSLPLDHVHVSLFAPYPGSPLFEQMYASGGQLPGWDEYNHYHDTERFSFCEVPTHDLRKAMKLFYLKFYSHPGRAWGLFKDIRRSGLGAFLPIAGRIFR